ncbi:glycosyl transferase family 2, partial [Streptococcus parasanguinis]
KLDSQFAEIKNDVNQELRKNKITYSEIKYLPNRMKYLLYRLHLLKMAFAIQGMK